MSKDNSSDAILDLFHQYNPDAIFSRAYPRLLRSRYNTSIGLEEKVNQLMTIGGCDTEKDTDTQIATLYFLLVTEILTDGLSTSTPLICMMYLLSLPRLLNAFSKVMALPVAYLRQAQLGRKKYLQTAGIFSVGLICIVVAICRGGTIGSRMRVNMPTFPWVAIWQMIEGGISMNLYPVLLNFVHKLTRSSDQR